MRHVIGIGLAIALAAAVFFAASWGYLRLLGVPVVNGGASTLPAHGGSLLHDTSILYAVAALAGTALFAGILVAAPRISPLAAGLPGLALLVWTIVYGFSVRRAVHYIPLRGDTFGTGFAAMLFNGLLAAAGVVLVVPLFIPSRWRSAARPASTGGYVMTGGAVPDQEPTTTLLIGDWADTAHYPSNDDDFE